MRRTDLLYRHRGVESLEYRRELRRLRRRRGDKLMLVLVVIGAVLLYLVIELGRGMLAMQEVKSFAATIDQKSPAEVKQELQHFAGRLTDRNPFVRNAAMAALKLGTGWNLGTDSSAWRQWWFDHEPHWQYRAGNTNTPAPATGGWATNLPPALEAPVAP